MMRAVPYLRRWIFVALPLLASAAGCRQDASESTEAPAADENVRVVHTHQRIRERTRARFDRAAFLSPAADSTADVSPYMATLIAEQLGPPGDPAGFTRFGRLLIDDRGRLDLDPDQLTMYLRVDQVPWGGRQRTQHLTVWFYPPAESGGTPRYRGVRAILDDRGFGVLWEVLSSDQPLRQFYVAKHLERAARQTFGPPLPGRRFSLEPPIEEQPEILVVRLVAEGPQPMGPFVYLDRESLAVINVLCRCEPAQADAFPQSTNYRLIPWPPFDAWPGAARRLRVQLASRLHEDLTGVLRLPE